MGGNRVGERMQSKDQSGEKALKGDERRWREKVKESAGPSEEISEREVKETEHGKRRRNAKWTSRGQ